MTHNTLLMTQIGILALLLVACLAAIALKRLKFPYTVGLVYDQKLISELTFDKLKLSLNLKQDDILAERIPPNHQLANPLTTSWEKMTDKFLRLVKQKLSPN